MKSLTQVSCSLNLGLIYNVNYDYSPDNGATISIYFVNREGKYQHPQKMQRAQITIGSASFSMYVVKSEIQLASGRRVMEVTFIDETFKLDNYYVTLTGRGCGYNIFELGESVDTRSAQQKQADALNTQAQQIADFTQYQDIEYSFNDFLSVLRQKFNVQVNAFFDATITRGDFTGTFRDVLTGWCSYYNLTWFIENGVIKIVDPTTLSITLPSQPSDALEYNDVQDIRDTYTKTVSNWFQQEGGEFPLSELGLDKDGNPSSSDNTLIRTNTLYPLGYEFGLEQTEMDLNQVAAAQYGQEFWFLYNYYLGATAENCGWAPLESSQVSNITNTTIYQSVYLKYGGKIAAVNNDDFSQRFEAFANYGTQIAGRYYLSNQTDSLAIDQGYQWFEEATGQIFSFKNVDSRAVDLKFLSPTDSSINIIEGTAVNQYFPGINYVGNRIVYVDNYKLTEGTFTLTNEQKNFVNLFYEKIYNIDGSSSMDFGELSTTLGTNTSYVAYVPILTSSFPQQLVDLFNGITDKAALLNPRFDSFPIKGVKTADYESLKQSQDESSDVKTNKSVPAPNVVGNTAVLKTIKDGTYSVYYDKYSKCVSAHSEGNYFQHKFDIRPISIDNPIIYSFQKLSNNTYSINRDYTRIEQLLNNPFLSSLAQGRTFATRRVSFTVNYFYSVPRDFLTNGLVNMSVSINEGGVVASYTFSNEVLKIKDYENLASKYENQIRNSWIRTYIPKSVIQN